MMNKGFFVLLLCALLAGMAVFVFRPSATMEIVNTPMAGGEVEQTNRDSGVPADEIVVTQLDGAASGRQLETDNVLDDAVLAEDKTREETDPVAGNESSGVLSSTSSTSTGQHADEVDFVVAEADTIDRQIPGDLEIVGKVLDDAGQPLPDMQLTIQSLDDRKNKYKIKTDFQGRYVFAGLAEGEFRITTVGTRVFPSITKIVSAGSASVDFILTRNRKVTVFGNIGTPANERLSNVSIDLNGERVAESQEGEYQLKFDYEANRVYDLRFRLSGYDDFVTTLDKRRMDHSTRLRVDVQLFPEDDNGVLTGTIRGNDGFLLNKQHVRLTSSKLGMAYRAYSDENGRFSINSIRPGKDYRLIIYPVGGYQRHIDYPIAITDLPTNLDVTLVKASTGSLTGNMVDTLGNPVADFSLGLNNIDVPGRAVAVKGDYNGFFEIDEVPEGALVMTSRTRPYIRITGIKLAPVEQKHVRLVLDLGQQTLSGTVVDENGTPVQGADVTLQWRFSEGEIVSSSTRKTKTDDIGSFSFAQLGYGEHNITVRAANFKPATISIDVGSAAQDWVVRLSRS